MFKTSFDFGENLGKLSFQQLLNHIRQNHPKKNNDENWAIGEPVGNLFHFGRKRVIHSILKDIGLGASLYLLTLKQFIWFFFMLSIMNIPLLLIYNSGTSSSYLLGQFDLGNLGDEGPICFTTNLAENFQSLNLECPSGTLRRLVGIGLSKV